MNISWVLLCNKLPYWLKATHSSCFSWFYGSVEWSLLSGLAWLPHGQHEGARPLSDLAVSMLVGLEGPRPGWLLGFSRQIQGHSLHSGSKEQPGGRCQGRSPPHRCRGPTCCCPIGRTQSPGTSPGPCGRVWARSGPGPWEEGASILSSACVFPSMLESANIVSETALWVLNFITMCSSCKEITQSG